MNARDLVRFGWNALTDRKLRASLTILGLVIGPATIVALVGATQGFSNAVGTQLSKTGATSIFVTPAGTSSSLNYLDVTTLQAMPGVNAAVPFYSFSGTFTQGSQTTSAQVVAIDLSQLQLVFPGLVIGSGSQPATNDIGGADIGDTLAFPNDPGKPNISIGQVVTVSFSSSGAQTIFFGSSGASGSLSSEATGQRSFAVRGIYQPFGQGLFINPDTAIFVPLSAGQSISHSNKYTGVIVVATSPSTVNQVTSEVTNHYGQKVRTIAVTSLLSTIQSVTGGTTTLLGAVAGISVLVALIGIMTTMFTTVNERTREIGILKAVGYDRKDVLSIFLTEASITGFMGGVIGALAGAGLSFIVVPFVGGSGGGSPGGAGGASAASALSSTPAITPELLLLATGLATLVGVLGGLLPAWHASSLSPVEALRQE